MICDNMLKNNKTFTEPIKNSRVHFLSFSSFKFVKTCALLPILMFSVCLLLTPGHAHATAYITGSYSASGYNDSNYNQGSDASNNSNSSVNNTVSTSTSAESNNSSSDNSNNSTNSSGESTTTVTNPATTTTTNVTGNQKPPIDKSATTVGVIIAIGAVVLVFIIAMLLWVKKHKAK
jgi:cobalamin biosynthesis Mg chelatase CobN